MRPSSATLGARALTAFSFALGLALVAPPAFAAPSVSLSPEFDLSPASVSFGNRDDGSPAVATNGTDYLVAWQDGGSAIHYARVTSAGALLDSPALALTITGQPAAFFDGTQYLVLAGTQGQRIDPATGTAGAAFTFAGLAGTTQFAFGGGSILATSSSASAPLTATLFDETGSVVSAPVTLPTGVPSGLGAAVGYGSGEFLVAWSGSGAPSAARVSSTGALLDATPISLAAPADAGVIAVGSAQLAVSGSPSGFLLSWWDQRDTGVYAARVSPAGVVADPGGFAVVSGTWSKAPAVIVWTGADWWATTLGSNDLDQYFVTIGADGTVGTASFDSFGAGNAALAVASGSRLAATPVTISSAAIAIEGTIYDTNGTALTGSFLVSTYLTPQTEVGVLASSRGYLAYWYEYNSPVGVRFRADGTAIDPVPVGLGTNVEGATSTGYLIYASGTGIVFVPDGTDGSDAGTPTLTSLVPRNGYVCIPGQCASVGAYPESSFYPGWRLTVLPLDGGAATEQPFYAPSGSGVSWPFAFASSGAAFLFAGPNLTAIPIAADGAVGPPLDGGLALPYDVELGLGWGTHSYMLVSWMGVGAYVNLATYRLDARGARLSGPEPLPLQGSSAFNEGISTPVWDGRAFFVAGAGASVPMAVEIPEDIVGDGGAPLAPFPLFGATGTPGLAAIPSVGALAVADQPRGVLGTTRAVARWVTFLDAGVDDDAGPIADSGPSTGLVDAGDAGDAGDASAPVDSGAPDATTSQANDASASAGDATVGQSNDASATMDDGGSATGPTSPDGSTVGDGATDGGDGDASSASGASSGCGCAVAGGANDRGGWLAVIGVSLAIARRRRSRSRAKDGPA